ncbi:MAG: hypothetical protein JWM89_2782 [Acidimicrobiales bacterium]|nr:hypothetical protein [Acidimicrobiales bacterium]
MGAVGRADRWLGPTDWGEARVVTGERTGRTRLAAWSAEHGMDAAIGILVLVTGVLLRRWVLRGPLGAPDLDESTVGLQALRFGRGHLATFFPHQAYGGTVETFLVSIVQRVAGADVIALKIVPMVCSLVAALLTWRAAVHLGLGRAGQWCAGLVVWCGPAYAVAFSTKERGFYGVALVLSAAYVLLVIRLDQRVGSADLVLLGACLGLGWWQTPLTMLVAVPAVGWLVARRPWIVRRSSVAAVAAVVCSLPWLVWNARNRWVSMNGGYAFGTTWWQRVEEWVVKLRVVTGIETAFEPSRDLVGGRWTGAVILGIVLAGATVRTRKQAPGLLAVLVVGYGALYALNGLAAGVGNDPRYTYLMVPAVALALASLLPDLASDAWSAAVTVAAAVLVVSLTAWGLAGLGEAARLPEADKFLSSRGIEEVAAFLESRHSGPVLTDIAGTQITYLTHERVRAGSFSVPRFRDLELAARSAPRSTYVLDTHLLGNAGRLNLYLTLHHLPYERRYIGRWSVFLIGSRVLPEQVPLLVFDFAPRASRGPDA